jgi:hypothetical protein
MAADRTFSRSCEGDSAGAPNWRYSPWSRKKRAIRTPAAAAALFLPSGSSMIFFSSIPAFAGSRSTYRLYAAHALADHASGWVVSVRDRLRNSPLAVFSTFPCSSRSFSDA